MRRTRTWFVAIAVTLALVGAACGDDDDDGDAGGTTDASLPTLPAGSTMKKLQDAGKIRIGVKYAQPGFGQKDPATNKVEGFDVEIGKLIAKRIFGDDFEDNIEFSEAVTAVREFAIQNDRVDIIIATYTINDARKKAVAFAGPYFVSEQDIMVKASDTSIKTVKDLNGKKVCTVQGSTSLTNLQREAPQATVELVLRDYADCVAAMDQGRVVAVTTDSHILDGLIKAGGNKFKRVGAPFSTEPYGIGLKKGDPTFRNFINDVLGEIATSGEYKAAFDKTLAPIGVVFKAPPAPDRYTESGEVVTATTVTTVAGTSTSGGATSTTSAAATTTAY